MVRERTHGGLALLLALALLGCGEHTPPPDTTTPGGEGDPNEVSRPDLERMRETLESGAEEVEQELFHHHDSLAELPFDLKLEEVTIAGAPGLHSFAAGIVRDGEHRGKWLMAGGRINGLHNFVGQSFPTTERNDRLWVVEPESGRVCSAPLTGLLVDIADALAATNHQAVQVDDVLWVDGGYGWSTNAQDNVTFGYLIAIDLPRIVGAVLDLCTDDDRAEVDPAREIPRISQYFSHGFLTGPEGQDCRRFGPGTTDGEVCDLSVTGGGIERVGDELFLAFGQHFGGRYNDFFNQQQIYACQVVRLPIPTPVWGETFTPGPVTQVAVGGPKCPPGGLVPNSDPFHRRDLNVLPTVFREGESLAEGLVAYGGVFKHEFFAYDEPIWVTGEGATVARGDRQHLGQYEAATVGLYSASNDALHHLILGGISSHYCTEGQTDVETPQCTVSKKIWSFPGFVEDGTLLTCQGGAENGADFACGQWSQAYLYEPFKVHNPSLPTGMMGSNTQFFPNLDVATHSNDVIDLDQLAHGEYTRVGTFYGGIAVEGKVPGQPFIRNQTRSHTSASPRAFAVWIKPR